jgi:hypothetical protein
MSRSKQSAPPPQPVTPIGVSAAENLGRAYLIEDVAPCLEELRGLMFAFSAIVKLAAEAHHDSNHIDWSGVKALTERAALVLLNAEEALNGQELTR